MSRLIFFFRLFAWFSFRHILKNRGRAAMVLLGVALGAAVFTSVRLSIHASLKSFTQSVDLIAGKADWIVVRPGGRVPEKLVAPLLRHPAVKTASPFLTTYVKPLREDAEPLLLIGFDPILDRAFRSWRIASADNEKFGAWIDLLAVPNTIVITETLARQYGLKVDDTLKLEHTYQKRTVRIAGKLTSHGLALVEGGRLAIMDIATFQEFTGLHGKVDRIDLRFKQAVTPSDLQSLRNMLPKGVALRPPTQNKEGGRRMIRAYQLNLSILSFVSLFVGMFLVYSLIALNAASRRRELAILLSLGASSRLLFFLFLAEGVLFGIFGWILAIPISTVLVKYMLNDVSQTISTLFVRVRVDQLGLGGWELFLSFGVTVIVSLLAAVQPAREAMGVAPKEALSTSRNVEAYPKSFLSLAQVGLGFIVLAWPVSKLPGLSGFPLPGYTAIFLIVVGFSLLSPWGLRHLGRIMSPLLRRIAGEPAFLGARYVRDSGTRTAISVGALITAVALFAALVIMIHSFRQTVDLWVAQTISGDLFIQPKMADFNQYRDPFEVEITASLERLKAPVDMQRNRRFYLYYDKDLYQFEAMDFDIFFQYGDFIFVDGDSDSVRPRLIEGDGVVISEVFAGRSGLGVGDRFQAQIKGGHLDLPILGIIRDYRTEGGIVFFAFSHFQKQFQNLGWSGARFFFHEKPRNLDAALNELRREIIEKCGNNLNMISGQALRRSILKIFDETFAITTVLLLIALVVAALGITTTLTVLVLERSRQLNTLYAVGTTFKQIRTMIFWEASLMIVAGETAGLACGFCLSYLLVFVINKESFGWTFHYGVDWGTLCWSLPLIFLSALLAVLPAARMVFREPPATLLRE
ncbi:FtsX-like permease family protein [Thermodesulfobacteriota bacterium]